jgi:cell fate regulator YaaT (PSP1 superfamily)
MGCSSCSSGGTPKGCKNNGNCSSGGCNKLEVYDWLANMSLPTGQMPYDIVEVRFKNGRKGFYRNAQGFSLYMGDIVVVEASPGYDVGVVSVVGELAKIQVNRKMPGFKPLESKKILRTASQEEIDKWIKARSLEKEVMYKSRTLAVNLNLEMKISDVEYQGDLTKATFYYTAEGRVDFRQLIKDMGQEFRIRIEMRQIGSRQEAARLGGIGSCGRELCCATWLTDFRSVSTSAARYQQLSLNPQKLAGQCGKLKCCLNYELDMYLDAVKSFPKSDTRIHTEKGTAYHIKTDVFKRQMWYAYEGEAGIGSGLIALSPDRVREIFAMNKEGKKPKELIEFVKETSVKEPDYENVVGQDSLNRFEHTFKIKKSKNKGNRKESKEQGLTKVASNKIAPNPSEKTNQQENKTTPQRNKRHKHRGNQKNKGSEGV